MKRANLIEAPKNQQLADILEYLQQIEHRLDNVNLEDNLFLLDRGCHSAHSSSTADKSMHKVSILNIIVTGCNSHKRNEKFLFSRIHVCVKLSCYFIVPVLS